MITKRRWSRRLRPWVLALALGAAPAACATNPVTGRQQLVLISESQEIQIGQEGAQQVEASIGLVQDEALQQYVQQLGAAMAARSERPNLPWRFRVVDDPTPNAFALPGGFIYVTRGLLTIMNSEAELASVLGHEIGHVTARHHVSRLSQQQLAQIGFGIGSILAPQAAQQLGGLAGVGVQLLFLRYGREDERQADELGFRYTLEQNYDVRDMVNVFQALQRVGESAGQSPLPSWLATHPYPEERIATTQQRIAALEQAPPTTRNRPQYLQRIDGMTFGNNPRHGFFQENEFIHPDLRFRFTLPAGWNAQNMTQAVVAVSPQEDAVVQLTLSPRDAATSLAAFIGQQGVQGGQQFQDRVNNIPVVGSTFQAQTEQGVVQGTVAYYSYEQRVYQLLLYSPAARFSAYQPTFGQVIGSFRALTDPNLLNVQPARIAIATTDQRTSLAAFNQRSPSIVPVETLAIINGLPSPESVVESGTRLKRVVR